MQLSLADTSNDTRQYADPRLLADSISGKIYLVVMRVRLVLRSKNKYQIPGKPYQSDLLVYRSDDDGCTWQYVSAPHMDTGDNYADLPFLAIDEQQCLLLQSGLLNLKYLLGASPIVIYRSCDGGISWAPSFYLDHELVALKRKNAGNIQPIDKQTYAGVFSDEAQLYYYTMTWRDSVYLTSFRPLHLPKSLQHLPIAYLYQNTSAGPAAIISYLPHQADSPIWLAYSSDGGENWQWEQVSKAGAYPSLLIDQSGIIHLTYSCWEKRHFKMQYRRSKKPGLPLEEPVTLYEGPFHQFTAGEYQALLRTKDGNLQLLFCDWSDGSKAKHMTIMQVPDY